MTPPRPSLYRDALTVSPERIAAMNDAELNSLMSRLIRTHAHRCGSPIDQVRVNAEGNAPDDGCDGWSAKPALSDPWLGSADTCWQFKAGTSGQPARLKGEVTKAIPRKTLAEGGRFVVVASGCTDGKKGEDDRKAILVSEANAADIAPEIDVIGSDRLAAWCSEHPAVAAYCQGRPDGLWTLEDWAALDEHRDPWQGTPGLIEAIKQQRADLDPSTGSIRHLHIQGHPGVGKTRFALELCRDAPWAGEVVYVPQAADARLIELIDSAALETDVRMVVVADEAQANQLAALRTAVERAEGRIRIITIGSSSSPDPARIASQRLEPLDEQGMREVVTRGHPQLPREQVDFVVRFADGYVRLARLAAYAVAHNPTMDVRGLLNRGEIQQFLDKILGDGNRRALHVVAALSSVGWYGDKANEGEAIAKHLGLAWADVCFAVGQFDKKTGVAPRSGRYRCISPTPLGNHLAVEAWTDLPGLMKTLPSVLPSEAALESYFERINSIASNPSTRAFGREQLHFFFRVEDFTNATAARCWSALSAADPAFAARNLRVALAAASLDDRLQLEGRARREVVGALVRIAWKSTSFRDAAISLALLAEAENETWANNATGEFLARFQVFLGGTAVSYSERLVVLDQMLAEGRPSMTRLAIRALALAASRHASRTDSGYPSDEVAEPEWRPSAPEDYRACVNSAIDRLISIAQQGAPEHRDELLAAAEGFSMMLREPEGRALVAKLFNAVSDTYPDAREPIRRVIDRLIHGETTVWKQLPPSEIAELEKLRKAFEGSDLQARLQQLLVRESWLHEDAPDLGPVSRELLEPENLRANWIWLTSGDASDAWRLGVALEGEDIDGRLAEILPGLKDGGKDLRIICGYICARRQRLGDQWYDSWVLAQARRRPQPIALLFELSWRCGLTKIFARVLSETFRSHDVAVGVVAPLGFSKWGDNLDAEDIYSVLRAMVERGHRATAIEVLAHRMESRPTESDWWKEFALGLVTTPELIRSGQMTAYYWERVASRLAKEHSAFIASAIFREQADRDSGIWFVEHSDASKVLDTCVQHDPNGVWEALEPHLSAAGRASRFSIGFPAGIIDQMPAGEVAAWIREDPHERAATIAKLASKEFSNDKSLSARLLAEYGDNEDVAQAFLGAYSAGSWWGSASSHYATLATNLDGIAKRTTHAKLRQWASDGARSLRDLAEAHSQREQEWEIGRR